MKGKKLCGKRGYRRQTTPCYLGGGNVNSVIGVIGNAADQFYTFTLRKPVIIDTMAFLASAQPGIQL
jgi:hypothetical protein